MEAIAIRLLLEALVAELVANQALIHLEQLELQAKVLEAELRLHMLGEATTVLAVEAVEQLLQVVMLAETVALQVQAELVLSGLMALTTPVVAVVVLITLTQLLVALAALVVEEMVVLELAVLVQ